MPLVSIIIPVIRPESAARCIEAVRRNAGIPPEQYEVLTERDTEGIGCPRMVKRLVERSRGEHVCFLGDDTIPQPGFLAAALEVMRQFPDGWGLVALNDGIHDGRLATHWLASRKLLPLLGGEFFHTGYQHNFCDLELTRRCRELGRYAYAKDARIRHDHPLAGGVDDAGRRKPRETYLADQVLYWRRLLAGQDFKLGIGFPSSIPRSTFSFSCPTSGWRSRITPFCAHLPTWGVPPKHRGGAQQHSRSGPTCRLYSSDDDGYRPDLPARLPY